MHFIIYINLFNETGKGIVIELRGPKLIKFQERCQKIAAVLTYEYSMITSRGVFYINDTLQ